MFQDIQNELMSKAAITTAAVVSADTFDLGAVGTDPSIGELMAGLFTVTAAAGGSPAATSYLFEVITSASPVLTSPTVIASSGAVLTAGGRLAVDQEVIVPIPQGSISQRYLGFRVTPTGGTSPTLSVSAHYVPLKEIPAYKPFPKAYTTI
jgi:hypothetical protein